MTRNVDTLFPVTPVQHGMLHHSQVNRASGVKPATPSPDASPKVTNQATAQSAQAALARVEVANS